MRILLTGANGQLGRHLAPLLVPLGEVVISSRASGDVPCDLGDPEALRRLLGEVRPAVIVNPAAWTAVDAAEDVAEEAHRLNAQLPAELAAWCRQHDALLVHYSTDYVFDGQPARPWLESDQPAPASVYGRSKLAGEQAIIGSGCRAFILRTAWLYSALPGNFLSAILARAARGEGLRVVADQIGSPTWAGSLAEMTVDLLRLRGAGQRGASILHAVDRGAMSWHEFAGRAVTLAQARGLIDEIVPVQAIGSGEWPQKACRPTWSVLEVAALETLMERPARSCEAALAACLNRWKSMQC